jgi:hypothetical protein
MATLPKVLINRPISNRRGCCTSSQNSGCTDGKGKLELTKDRAYPMACTVVVQRHAYWAFG